MFNVYDSSADCYCVEFPIDNYRNISPGGQGYQSVSGGGPLYLLVGAQVVLAARSDLPPPSSPGHISWWWSVALQSRQVQGSVRTGGGHRLTLELELTSPSEISQSYVTTSQHTFLLGDFSPVLQQVIQDQRNYRE